MLYEMQSPLYHYDPLPKEAVASVDPVQTIDGIEYVTCRDFSDTDINPVTLLSDKDFELLSLATQGISGETIGAQLGFKQLTVRRYINRIGAFVGLDYAMASEVTSFLPIRRDLVENIDLACFTKLEQEVFACLGRGMLSAEIGYTLGKSASAVREHQVRITKKLNVEHIDAKRVAVRRIAGAVVQLASSSDEL